MVARHRNERGQGTMLALCAVVMVALATVLVGRVIVAATQQARAQHAADAAALAGVAGGRSAALAMAAGNDAELVTYQQTAGRAGGSVRVDVTVRQGDRMARASAEGDLALPRSGSP